MNPARPRPVPTQETEAFWKMTGEGRLALPWCRDCGKPHFYPRTLCPHCGSAELEWRAASGRGTVFSVTVVHRAPGPAFAEDVPYAIAVVALAEGPHLMSRVVGCPPDSVRIGMPVEVEFQPLDDAMALPLFRPAAA